MSEANVCSNYCRCSILKLKKKIKNSHCLSQSKSTVFNSTRLEVTKVSAIISDHKTTICLPSQALGYTSEFLCQHSEIVKVEELSEI